MMKIPDILKNLRSNAGENIEYDDKYNHFLQLISDPNKVAHINFDRILLILDKRPFSLLPMAYAIRMANAFDSKIVAMTQGTHSKMLKQECLKLKIPVQIIEFKEFDFEDVKDIMKKHEPNLVIINLTHDLREKMQQSLRIPMLIVKASQMLDM